MQRGSGDSRRFAAAWLLVVVALSVAVGAWGAMLSHEVGPLTAEPASTPTAAALDPVVPRVVTDYTQDHTATADALCTQLSPQASVVTVETPTGIVLETLQCAGESNSMGSSWFAITVPGAESTFSPSDGCVYVQAPDGGHSVMSATTGSLLTAAQAANCSK